MPPAVIDSFLGHYNHFVTIITPWKNELKEIATLIFFFFMTYIISRVNALVCIMCFKLSCLYGVATTIKIGQKIFSQKKEPNKNTTDKM